MRVAGAAQRAFRAASGLELRQRPGRLAVLDQGRDIGRIEDVQFGAGEAPLLIVRDAGGRLVEIPFAEAYLDSVDVERKQVRMKLPEGLLEVNAPITAEEKREQTQPDRKKRR